MNADIAFVYLKVDIVRIRVMFAIMFFFIYNFEAETKFIFTK